MNLDIFSEYPQSVVSRFVKFHNDNLNLYDEFKRLAEQTKQSGRTKYSARTLMEVLRWNRDVTTAKHSFKINNDFIPLYIRMLVVEYPEFCDFFNMREVRSRGVKSEAELEAE